MRKFIIISGPTGIGKTSVSIDLATLMKTEIISCDSMQLYKGLDIGTAKISKVEMKGIRHHLLDVIDFKEDFSIEDYKHLANEKICDLNACGKLPLIVGGTGFYIEALVYDMNFALAPPNENLRRYYKDLALKYGNSTLYNVLKNVDPLSAERIHPNQVRRIVRALEVFEYTNKPMSSFNNYSRKLLDDADFKHIFLNMNRQILYDRINRRVDIMIENGLIDEVIALKNAGASLKDKSMNSIGYKEVLLYLNKVYDKNTMVEKIKQASRNYAKRQITWFKRDENKIELDITNKTQEEIIIEILRIIGDNNV